MQGFKRPPEGARRPPGGIPTSYAKKRSRGRLNGFGRQGAGEGEAGSDRYAANKPTAP